MYSHYISDYNRNGTFMSALHDVKDYLVISDFARVSGYSPESIMRYRREKLVPDYVFNKKEGQAARVDKNWFERRWAFQHQVKMYNQEVYYLLEENFCTLEMARTIERVSRATMSELTSYLQYTLFKRLDGKLGVGLSPAEYAVYRYGHAIDRRLKHNGTSITKILDIRAGLC